MTPSIVLVNTQMSENIGAAARAMMNFGLPDLRLVAPREEWPSSRAYDLAGHARGLLDSASLFASTREAVKDCARVYAATARSREMVKPVLTPLAAMQRMREENLPTAILFGPERTGLTNDDVTIADAIITIPTASDLASLNVAQSVVVLAYQWFQVSGFRFQRSGEESCNLTPDTCNLVHKSPFASKDELRVLFDHLERELDAVDFWKVEDKKPKMWLNLRNIFARASLTDQEVRTLHGVIAALRESR
jgi:tRNA/rRNA methyltransferase